MVITTKAFQTVQFCHIAERIINSLIILCLSLNYLCLNRRRNRLIFRILL